MNIIKEILNKLNYLSALISVSLLMNPIASFAADETQDVRQIFRKQLLASIGDAFLNNGLLDWSNNSFLKYMFSICLAIAIFQVVYLHYGKNNFLLEWVKIPIYALVSLAILGGWSGYTKIINIPSPPGVSHKVKTLDKDIYYALAYQFDDLAAQLDRMAGPDQYQIQAGKLFIAMKNIQYAIMGCNVKGDKQCLMTALANMEKEVDKPLESVDKDPGTFEALKMVASRIMEFIDMMTSPVPFWIIYVVIWILEIIRMFINYFTLIVFALITAISLFFCKIFTVFLVLPDFRQKVWTAYKMPLSATMYGFVTSLIISCSTVIVKGINEAMVKSLINQLKVNNEITTMDAMHVLFGSALATSSILGIQILSMSKVPGLCRKLWDLSLTELAEFGKTVIEAGLGALKTVGGAAVMGAAAVATGGAAAFAAKAGGATMGGAMTQGLSSAGRSLTNMASGKGLTGGPGAGGLKGLLGLAGGDVSSSGGDSSGGSSLGNLSKGGGGGGSGGGSGTGGGGSGGGITELAPSPKSLGSRKSDKKDGDKDPMSKLAELEKKEKEAKSDSRWAMADKFLGGATTVAKGAASLAGAGIDVGMGKEGANTIGWLNTAAPTAIAGVDETAKEYIKHRQNREEISGAKQQLLRQNMDQISTAKLGTQSQSFTKKEAEDLVSKMERNKKTKDSFSSEDHEKFNELANGGHSFSPELQSRIDSQKTNTFFTQHLQNKNAEAEALAQSVESGSASEAEITKFHKMLNNKQNGIENDVKRKLRDARKSSSYTSWNEERKAQISAAVEKASIRNKDGDFVGINEEGTGALVNAINSGYLTETDLGENKKLREVYSEISKKVDEEIISEIDYTNMNYESARKQGNMAKMKEYKQIQEELTQYMKTKESSQRVGATKTKIDVEQWDNDIVESTRDAEIATEKAKVVQTARYENLTKEQKKILLDQIESRIKDKYKK